MNIRYRVTLSEAEKAQLEALLGGGSPRAREVKRAQILLAAAEGQTEERIARAVHTSAATIYRVKRSFVEEGLNAALHEAHRPGGERKLSGKEEALQNLTTATATHASCAFARALLLDGNSARPALHHLLCVVSISMLVKSSMSAAM